jgi:hypothetical protein
VTLISPANRKCVETFAGEEPIFRRASLGPELELVHEYLSTSIPEPGRDENLCVLIEPKIEDSYPDIVIIYSNKNSFERWSPERRNLTRDDFKVMHCIYLKGNLSDKEISSIFPNKLRDESISKLHLCGLIKKQRNSWKISDLRSNYAIRQLVAVEAKMSLNEKVIKQSIQNTWFSPESYALVPKLSENNINICKAEQHGIKIVMPTDKLVRQPRRAQTPISYASWLLNEWAWRSTLNKI